MSYDVTVSGTNYEGIEKVQLPITGTSRYADFVSPEYAESIVDNTVTTFESSTLTKVPRYKFMGCNKLTKFNAPNLSNIDISAFDGCTALAEFNFIKVATIANSAFYGCKALTGTIEFPVLANAIGKNAFQGCTGIEKVVLPNMKQTGTGMFNGCTSLKVIDLGGLNSIYNIATQAFVNCSALEALIIRSNNVIPGTTDSLIGTPIANGTASDTCFIYVPSALVDSYKQQSGWNTYANQFRAIEDYPEICG